MEDGGFNPASNFGIKWTTDAIIKEQFDDTFENQVKSCSLYT